MENFTLVYKILNIALILSLVSIPVIFASKGRFKEAGLTILAIALALSFNNLDKFSRFKGAGFEAELNTAVNKTYAAIEQVKKLAVSISDPIASSLATSDNAFTYVHLKYKIEQIENIRQILKELEIPNKEIDDALNVFTKRIRRDHMRRILNHTNKSLPESNKIFANIKDINTDEWTLDKVRALLNENKIEPDGELKEVILDLEYWEIHKRLRRENKWQG